MLEKSSPAHIMPLFSIDSYGLNYRPLGFGKFEKKQIIVKRFDFGTLGFLEPDEHKEKYGEDLNCNCFIDKGRKFKEILEVYGGAELLSSALTSHEAVASFIEFIRSRKRIIENDYENYLRSKPYMVLPMKKFFGIDLKQKRLM